MTAMNCIAISDGEKNHCCSNMAHARIYLFD